MATTIVIKRSTTGGNVPTLSAGEIATNLVDKRVFTANSTVVFDAMQNTVSNIAITNSSGGAFNVGNSTINAVVNSSSIALVNSTVTFIISKPTAADYAAATKFLSANGSFLTPTAAAAAGGSNTEIQFNDSTAILGNSAFTFDKSTNVVTLTGTYRVGNSTVNAVINSSSYTIANSTVTLTVQLPTAAQAANQYFLQANGAWSLVQAASPFIYSVIGGF